MLTEKNATRLATRIAEHRARGCYCPTCAEDSADLSMDGRDQSGRRYERANS